jgi:NSS family neurotransmitter:Na+ symporter
VAAEQTETARRGSFSSRRVFILAAIGSAVGLGNIWRFPYVAYENGGGAFVIPYLVALFVAGIPFLLLDYAMGHRYQGSPPLALARFSRGAESLGWWQVGVCWFIGLYYMAILVWASLYTWYSLDKSWGDDPEGFFYGEVLEIGEPGVSLDFVPQLLIPLVVFWVLLIVVLALGVQKGVGMTSVFFIPLLVLVFGVLVVQSLFLDGAASGLDALFTPHWAALSEPSVWAAAFGQIFFSLSIGFGIMVTYASYVRRKENLTGSAMVIGLSNSGFEVLAGIGVFSALGFMAQAAGTRVDEVVSSGIGLAFITFPTIVSNAPGGSLMGVLFFASLVMAGLTSMISIVEVVVSAVRDKFDLSRVAATLLVLVPTAVVSTVLFGTTTSLYVLDVVDHFINQFGILLAAVVMMIVIAWAARALPQLARHLNRYGSVRVGPWWYAAIGLVAPVMLVYILVEAFRTDVGEAYGGYPEWFLLTFGWGAAFAALLFGVLMAAVPWQQRVRLRERTDEEMFLDDDELILVEVETLRVEEVSER